MERVKEALGRRLEDSHEDARLTAKILFSLGCLNAVAFNYSHDVASFFWQNLIVFLVNLVPKTNFRYALAARAFDCAVMSRIQINLATPSAKYEPVNLISVSISQHQHL
jgi:hypothetical protein